MQNYDAWLEKPYDDDAQDEERFSRYWDQYGTAITQAIKDSILRDAPSGDLVYLKDQLWPIVDDMSEVVLVRWGHNLDTVQFPDPEDWEG